MFAFDIVGLSFRFCLLICVSISIDRIVGVNALKKEICRHV